MVHLLNSHSLASAFAAIANGGTYNNAHSIQKVVTHDGDTIEYDHSSHKAMKDYTAYMLAEILKGTFKAYGSAYGHGVSGVNLGAKTGTGTYGAKFINNITYQIVQLKTYGLTDLVLNTQCQYGWASIKLNNTVLTHLSATLNKNIHNIFSKM